MSRPTRELAWQVVDGEAIIVDVASGDYFSLNRVATEVWTGLHRGQTVGDIVQATAGKYATDRAIVERDVGELIGELREIGLWTG